MPPGLRRTGVLGGAIGPALAVALALATALAPATALVLAVALALAGCSSTTASPRVPTAGPATAGLSRPGSASPRSTAIDSPRPAGRPAATESNPPGDIPDNTAFVAFRPGSAKVTVRVPEGWARAATTAGTTFTDKLNSITIQTRRTPRPRSNTLVIGTEVAQLIKAAGANVSAMKASAVRRHAGAAVLITYLADSAVNPVTGKVVRDAVEWYEFWHAGTEVDLTLFGPVGADNVHLWRTVTDSLAWQ